MSKKHRAELREAVRKKKVERVISKMTLGDVIHQAAVIFSPLKDMKFEAIKQPLYTSDMFR
jgi:hypothetical protein